MLLDALDNQLRGHGDPYADRVGLRERLDGDLWRLERLTDSRRAECRANFDVGVSQWSDEQHLAETIVCWIAVEVATRVDRDIRGARLEPHYLDLDRHRRIARQHAQRAVDGLTVLHATSLRDRYDVHVEIPARDAHLDVRYWLRRGPYLYGVPRAIPDLDALRCWQRNHADIEIGKERNGHCVQIVRRVRILGRGRLGGKNEVTGTVALNAERHPRSMVRIERTEVASHRRRRHRAAARRGLRRQGGEPGGEAHGQANALRRSQTDRLHSPVDEERPILVTTRVGLRLQPNIRRFPGLDRNLQLRRKGTCDVLVVRCGDRCRNGPSVHVDCPEDDVHPPRLS